jgi:hypothetical protein
MPDKNEDQHGDVPDKSDVVLLMIDVINDLDFPEGISSSAMPCRWHGRSRPEGASEPACRSCM